MINTNTILKGLSEKKEIRNCTRSPYFWINEFSSKRMPIDRRQQLECYDKKNSDKPNNQGRTSAVGNWKLTENKSPADYSKTIKFSLTTKDDIRIGIKSGLPILILRRMENKTSLYVDWGTFISTTDPSITLREDKKKASSEHWRVASNHEAVFSSNATPTIKSMIDKSNLMLQVTPFSDQTYIVSFDITRLDNAINPTRETCG